MFVLVYNVDIVRSCFVVCIGINCLVDRCARFGSLGVFVLMRCDCFVLCVVVAYVFCLCLLLFVFVMYVCTLI